MPLRVLILPRLCKCFLAPLKRSLTKPLDEKRCSAQCEFAFASAARAFSAAQNTHVSEPTIDVRRWSVPSSRRHVLETGSPVETSSVPKDRTLCESALPPLPALPHAMHRDCSLIPNAATSSHFACFAKLRAMPVPASCLRRLAHKAKTRRRSTFAASFPSPATGAGKDVLLCRDTENRSARRGQRSPPPTAHSLRRRMRRRHQPDAEGCPPSPDQASTYLSPPRHPKRSFSAVLELSVLDSCAGLPCLSKWVIRTVLWEAADGLLICWIQPREPRSTLLRKGVARGNLAS